MTKRRYRHGWLAGYGLAVGCLLSLAWPAAAMAATASSAAYALAIAPSNAGAGYASTASYDLAASVGGSGAAWMSSASYTLTVLSGLPAGGDPGAGPDSDGDGLPDSVETNTGTYNSPSDTGTDPLNPDSDSDGLADGFEVNETGTDPTFDNRVAASGVLGAGELEGIGWFDGYTFDGNGNGFADHFSYEYGLLRLATPESHTTWESGDPNPPGWHPASPQVDYLIDPDNGSLVPVEDRLTITGFTDEVPSRAVAVFYQQGTNTIVDEVYVTLNPIDLSGQPLVDYLFEVESTALAAFANAGNFSAGATLHAAVIEAQRTTHWIWCDDSWDPWFQANLACDNIVPLPDTDNGAGDGTANFDPATSLDQLLFTAAQYAGGAGVDYATTLHVAGDYSYELRVFLEGATGSTADLGGTAHYFRFEPNFAGPPTVTPLVTDTWTRESIGGRTIVAYVVPASLAEASELDADEVAQFLTVASDALGGSYVRSGEWTEQGQTEVAALYDEIALNDILAAFQFPDADYDGLTDAEEAAAGTNPAVADSDGDGLDDGVELRETLTDPTDPDSDGDGLSDGAEVNTHETDPNNPDSDGDGISDGDEVANGTDPHSDDITPPEVTAPPDVSVGANGDLTSVGLEDGGSASALDARDGPLEPTPDTEGPFVVGCHTVTWSATDLAGNVGSAAQQVCVLPRVNFAIDRTVAEGGTFRLLATLSAAFGAEVQVPFTIDDDAGSATAGVDHDALAGTLLFPALATVAESAEFTAADDGLGDDGETVEFVMSEEALVNAVPGARKRQTVTLSEANLKPTAALSAAQGGSETALVVTGDGGVTVQAVASDPNPGQTLSYDWSASDARLFGTQGPDDTYVFDPAGLLADSYLLKVTVSDNGVPAQAVTVERLLKVVTVDPLSGVGAAVDSDGDGVPDLDEGYGDSDNDGIPDYLDSDDRDDRLPSGNDGGSLQSTPGTKLRIGKTSTGSGLFQGSVTAGEIADYGADGQPAANADDSEYLPVGNYFDFEVAGLNPGGTVQVVLPLPLDLTVPAAASYRKYTPEEGWQPFDTSGENGLASALRDTDGNCPEPDAADWVDGLTEGDECVRLTIVDGGPNDADGTANGNVEDPGGVVRGRPAFTLDIDADVAVTLANDGYLILRDFLYRDLVGPSYSAALLTSGLTKSPGAQRWDNADDVKGQIESMRAALVTDIDDDSSVTLANDGYLILRDFLYRDLVGPTYSAALLTSGLTKTDGAQRWDDPQAIKDLLTTLRDVGQ